jgi:hypothetical protein
MCRRRLSALRTQIETRDAPTRAPKALSDLQHPASWPHSHAGIQLASFVLAQQLRRTSTGIELVYVGGAVASSALD